MKYPVRYYVLIRRIILFKDRFQGHQTVQKSMNNGPIKLMRRCSASYHSDITHNKLNIYVIMKYITICDRHLCEQNYHSTALNRTDRISHPGNSEPFRRK